MLISLIEVKSTKLLNKDTKSYSAKFKIMLTFIDHCNNNYRYMSSTYLHYKKILFVVFVGQFAKRDHLLYITKSFKKSFFVAPLQNCPPILIYGLIFLFSSIRSSAVILTNTSLKLHPKMFLRCFGSFSA